MIKWFSKGESDPKEVAKKVGFKDHRELAVYMRAKGYYWDDAIRNYKREETADSLLEEDSNEEVTLEGNLVESTPKRSSSKLKTNGYEDILEFLIYNEDILRSLIESAKKEPELGQIPRYAVPGIPGTKSIYMKNTLAQLVADFSKEKNVNQNSIVEAALIEYFRKYGYKKEVETLLGM